MKEFFFVENTQKDTQETTKVQEGNQQTAQETAYNHTLVASTAQQTARLAQKHTNCRIFVRSERKWIPVSKEYYEMYMRGIHTFRNRQYRQGLCKCPGTKEYMCDCDCLTCPFYKKDVIVSLDAQIFDDEGNEETLMDRLMDENTLSPEEALLEKDEHESLYKAIDQLCEEDRILIMMTLAEKPQIEIAEALGLKGQSNVAKRKQRALKALREAIKQYE